ncbi:DUF6671 family protein [Microbacterium sp. NPDC057407]|uniref:DUF6671 family protein n=1 Tax=Microbacterium sp. NPDC057407 TaxID=3346120 RepID=UPI0036725F3D
MAWKLTARLQDPCPSCDTPGFGQTGIVAGLPCAQCAAPTRQPLADVLGCSRCDHRAHIARPDPVADPATCDQCNP